MREYKEAADILDALKAAQEGKGYLSDEDICAVAKKYGRYPSEVYETATFYTMLDVGGKAEHVTEVCGSTCCDAAKAAALVAELEKELGMETGDGSLSSNGVRTTADGKWMLRRCECLGRCDTAPNAMVDGSLVTDATAEGIIEFIRKAGK